MKEIHRNMQENKENNKALTMKKGKHHNKNEERNEEILCWKT